MRSAQADIDLAALKHNLQQVRLLTPGAKVLAMIKSDGYGHGAVRVARALNTADGFGVASVGEAVLLRQAGIPQTIMVMSHFSRQKDLTAINEFNLGIVLHHPHQLTLLAQQNWRQPLTLWIKIDTGMHRLGFLPDEVLALWQHLQTLSWVKHPIGIMTHLACADEDDQSLTDKQVKIFADTVAPFPGECSVANSAAILRYPKIQQHWVRPGIMLYGVSPFGSGTGTDFSLQAVMTLRSHLIAVKWLQSGDAVGYGATWTCPEPMPVGVVAIGYGDGYPRHAVSGTPVLVNGVKCPLIGRVSMDLISVDLRPCPDAKIEDPIVLWGQGLPIEIVARSAGTIDYELLCHMNSERVRFIEVH